MSDLTERRQGESYISYLKRIVGMTAAKQIKYTEMGDALIGDRNVYSEDNLRKGFYLLSKICDNIGNEADYSDNDVLNEIKEQRRLLEQEKVQLRDERAAYNVQNRNTARLEQKLEYLENVLTNIGSDRFPPYEVPVVNGDNDLLVVLSDLHIGATFDSAFGKFDSDIAKARLNEYLNEILKIRKRHNSQNAYVVLAGDLINNSIHKTIAITNRENVIDQIKLAVDYISAFCFELSRNFSEVRFIDCAGNHSRIDRKEDALHDERLDSLIAWTVSKLLSSVGNFGTMLGGKIDTGIAELDIRGKKYIAVHGDYDGMGKTNIAKLMLMLGTMPYAVIMGHRHFPAVTDESGIRVIQGGSLSGAGDDYTIEKRLCGKPSQTVCICTESGIECVYPIMLK